MSVGSTLERARRQRGLSVDEVSQSTRIRPHIVGSIEHDEFAACGGDVYARGHIRTLASTLQVDPAPLVAEYDAAHRSAPPVPLTLPGAPGGPAGAPGTPRWMTAALVLLTLVAIIAALQLLLARSTPTARPGRLARPGPSLPPKGSHPVPTPARPAPATPASLVVRVTGLRCWVSVQAADGRSLVASVLTTGQQVSFTDPTRLQVILGDAQAVDVVVNGHDLGAGTLAGAANQFVITPTTTPASLLPAAAGAPAPSPS